MNQTVGLLEVVGWIAGIEAIDAMMKSSAVELYGTKENNGKVFTNGGRVIAVTSYGKDFNAALKQSYNNTDIIDWDKKYFRSDLGFDLQQYLN